MIDLYTIDTGTGTYIEFYRRPGETQYEVHVYITINGKTEEFERKPNDKYSPERLRETIDRARTIGGVIVTTPYDDDLRHEQNH